MTRTSALPKELGRYLEKPNGSEGISPPGDAEEGEGNYSHVAQIREANTQD